mmetsp:Transcript_1268/g.132  ORF Transcript_1268/g.132 Transcript_1268/m.132 type:complete len:131 (-) Transcript_1268:1207-1599(-)|eukprot:CAMPEP_0168316102 /NCGR_PEP_ID=MMETSP0210-20121227/14309_1 /TAXON_ID=40633 /ORGANISM="Condylostoma magnum, Strain COL2" /LENGTH=130 /DNA_ID=CAMNT_0008294731 /DNA_START=143 /DNA_END=535 /DNA_ORIENTATION=-
MGFSLAPEQAEQICNRYRTADGISYRAFLNEMETGQLTRTTHHIVTSKGKKPDLHEDLTYDGVLDNHMRTVGPYQYTTKPVIEGTIKRDIPNDLDDLLSKLRLIIKQRRIRVKEFITDHDRLRSGLVTKN